MPNALVRAYADDTAIVSEDLKTEGPILAKIFHEFSQISGLHLNNGKCITIPLGTLDLEGFRQSRDTWIPTWNTMPICGSGKYLGYWIGPDIGDKSWADPLQKYMGRCRAWSEQGMGLFYQVMVCNTFAMSTLSFVAQLEAVPSARWKSRGVEGRP